MRVLLTGQHQVGRCTASMTLAIVKVLPEPVTPRRVCSSRPFSMPAARAAMASRLVAGGLIFADNF